MPLTPEAVRTWEFGTTWFRRGYSQPEVDAFLELVEEELVDRDIQIEQVPRTTWFDSSQEPPAPPPWQADPGPVSGPEAAEGTMTAAARLLQMAEESSASTIAEARQEADRILSRARGEAGTILSTARRQAEQALQPLIEQRDELQRHIAGLQAIAREGRRRLRAYADEPLPGLDAGPGDDETARISDAVPVPPGGSVTPPPGNGSRPAAPAQPGG